MSEQFYPLIAAALGFAVGIIISLVLIWVLRRRKPHWFAAKEIENTALVSVLIGMAFALLSYAIGSTFFLLYLLYGIAATGIGFGVVTAIRSRRKAKRS